MSGEQISLVEIAAVGCGSAECEGAVSFVRSKKSQLKLLLVVIHRLAYLPVAFATTASAKIPSL